MQEYNKIDQQLHLLSQLIAKANRTYVPVKDDDSHTNLYFDALGNKITGHWIDSTTGKLLFTLNLNNQKLEILDESFHILAGITTVDKKLNEIEKDIEGLLPEIGLNPMGFTEKLHFEISHYNIAEKQIAPFDSEGFIKWRYYRHMANQACSVLLGFAQAEGEVRIWPHHFDTGIYFEPKTDLGVGFGLAMKDDMAGAPYFYLSAYPEGKEIEYKDLPVGKWQWVLSDGWKGAIISLDKISQVSKALPNELSNYLRDVYTWIIKQ